MENVFEITSDGTKYRLYKCKCADCSGDFPLLWPGPGHRRANSVSTTCPLCGAHIDIDMPTFE